MKRLFHSIVILAIIQLCNTQTYRQNNEFLRKHSRFRYDIASIPDKVENDYDKYFKHPSSDTLNIKKRSEQVSMKTYE